MPKESSKRNHHYLLLSILPNTNSIQIAESKKVNRGSAICSLIARLQYPLRNLAYQIWSRYVGGKRCQKIPCLKWRSSSFSSIFFLRSRRVKLYLVINTSRSDCDCPSTRPKRTLHHRRPLGRDFSFPFLYFSIAFLYFSSS